MSHELRRRSVHWSNSAFLIISFLIMLTAVPVYLWNYGLSWFQVGVFLVLFVCTGLSITLGYHRLFSHLTFKAHWSVRSLVLLFGASAFEGPALVWAADHRRHHKFVDHDDDPYDISKGFFHAHIGWIMFKLLPENPPNNVNDLKKDPLIMLQDRYYYVLAVLTGFVILTLAGLLWDGMSGALGGFLIGGVTRIVCVQHMTFFINSLCHTIGNRPYSSKCTARDSWLMAVFTFGEGYHNFHHEFQHDYRNGVKPWQFDPTKWVIWTLNRLGLVKQLRRVPEENIMLAQVTEKQRRLSAYLNSSSTRLPESTQTLFQLAQDRLHQAALNWEERKKEYVRATEARIEASREKILQLQHRLEVASANLRLAISHWHSTHRLIVAEMT